MTHRKPPSFSVSLGIWTLALFVGALRVTAQGAETLEAVVSHPLDPLLKSELATVLKVLKASGKLKPGDRVSLLALAEPSKEDVLRFELGNPIHRKAFAVLFNREARRLSEAIVDINAERVHSWREVPGAQPGYHGEDFRIVNEIVRSDPRWQEAIRKRGITDPQRVLLDTWGPGPDLQPEEREGRGARVIFFDQSQGTNPYAHPIEGLIVSVDLKAKKVVRVQDTGTPIPQGDGDFDTKSISPARRRPAPKPLVIGQPEGASFEVRGHEIRWQNWRFRFALHPREGLVLHRVGYEERGKLRSILHRASVSEMIVPYGDPAPGWSFRNAFDEGEYGFGVLADSLEPGTDCPPNACFFDATFAGDDGDSYREISRAVALYERDGGVLWRHTNRDVTETRRARELVLTSYSTLGNYSYGFEWIFHQDGTLEVEVVHTGIMLVKGEASMNASAAHGASAMSFGHAIAPGLSGIHHQHFFNYRLDFDVDGINNCVVELTAESLPEGPENPYGNAFQMKETPLRSEREARRRLDLASARKWKVMNASVKNGLGHPTGYLLVPSDNAVPYASVNSSIRKRAGFLEAHVWATQFEPSQMYAAGDYPTLSSGGEGLPKWVEADRSLEDQDVVLWYTLGLTHIPRPEEWPIMPSRRAGFVLMPSDFFTRNPTLDVPRTP